MGRIRKVVSLLHQIEAVPVSAEVLDLAGGELEPGAELAVLEEDVCIPEAGCVEVLPLPLLGEDALDALDESDLLEDPDLPVACGDRDVILVADLLDGARRDLSRYENPLRVLVREQARDILFSHCSRFSVWILIPL